MAIFVENEQIDKDGDKGPGGTAMSDLPTPLNQINPYFFLNTTIRLVLVPLDMLSTPQQLAVFVNF